MAGISDIPRGVAVFAHVMVVTGLIAMAGVFVFACTGSRLAGIMFLTVTVPAWLIIELTRAINRRDDPRHKKLPTDTH